ncbi:MAG: 3-phosphoshikimate 1-carboxyvinyltransferase [Bacteroidia bacterium]|nr:3-phosphoshikimate 1-carboxyvinyltransferase [Bacteroidia bacterium]
MHGLYYNINDIVLVNIDLPTSKSISNRALILNALLDKRIILNELSSADDTQLMQSVLLTESNEVNLQNAGTCMRFFTAYFACVQHKNINLFCSQRMEQRPIKPLVDALLNFGADINYLANENFPPLKIYGKKLKGKSINIDASESSQFISALMLIAPFIENGITLNLTGNIASYDYIKMTALLMQQFGFSVSLSNSSIAITAFKNQSIINNYTIEKDWSAAAFWYLIVALKPKLSVNLIGLTNTSIQGDSITAAIFEKLGISSIETNTGLVIKKDKNALEFLEFNLLNAIDLAPALCVACAALNINATIFGLQNLKIKESNRLLAIVNELNKFGYAVNSLSDAIIINQTSNIDFKKSITINTYNDHRIAMAFAPLAILFNQLKIDDITVVTKSYPNYFNDLKLVGIGISNE